MATKAEFLLEQYGKPGNIRTKSNIPGHSTCPCSGGIQKEVESLKNQRHFSSRKASLSTLEKPGSAEKPYFRFISEIISIIKVTEQPIWFRHMENFRRQNEI